MTRCAVAGLLVVLCVADLAAAQDSMPAGRRLTSNTPLSVEDIVELPEALPPARVFAPEPTATANPNRERAPQRSMPLLPDLRPAPPTDQRAAPPRLPAKVQVDQTRLPRANDGLAGNRAVALSPFPNLDLESGPLETEQLPWFHKPFDESGSAERFAIEYQSMMGMLESNGFEDSEFGWSNSVQVGMPFWRERQIGAQVGLAVEPTTFPQLLFEFTGGFFHRALWPQEVEFRPLWQRRISWGAAYDALYDSEFQAFIGQARVQVGYAVAPHRECGAYAAIPMHDDEGADTDQRFLIDTSALGGLYYRHVFPREVDLTILMGPTEYPGSVHFGGYLSGRFAPQAFWVLSGMTNFEQRGAFSVYAGLRIHFWPLDDYAQISGNPRNLYRPFLPLADHIQLQVRKRRR